MRFVAMFYVKFKSTSFAQNPVSHPCRVMNTYEEYEEEELNDYIIQLSIQDSCQDAFLKSAARYGSYIQTSPSSKQPLIIL